MTDILVPTLNTNDTAAKLLEWKVKPGAAVKAGEIVAVLETSKATFDLESPGAGILHPLASEGQSCPFQSAVARLFGSKAELEAHLKAAPSATGAASHATDPVLSKDAARFAQEHGIIPEQIRALGKSTIRTADLAALVDGGAGSSYQTSHQEAVARTVTLSHQTIPTSFALMKMRIDRALAHTAGVSANKKMLVGLPDLIVHLLAQQQARHPKCFGHMMKGRFSPMEAHIGVIMDVGQGPTIPVIRNAGSLGLEGTAKEMMALRVKAMRGTFKAADLEGASIGISLNTEEAVWVVQPLIQPPQVAMLTMGAVHQELTLVEGRPTPSSFVMVGLTYDHRILNGSDAVALLTDLRLELENFRA
ncbi:MAG: 2-oxo acid dehydrogenase subunit E2 [Planctomycetota bacterium]